MSLRQKSRQRILDAASQLAQDQGSAHLSLDAVAALAGMSKGGLLYHFPNKTALLKALVEQHVERSSAAWDRQLEREDRQSVPLEYFTAILLSSDTLPPLEYVPVLMLMGVMAAVGHFAMVNALSFAPASMLSPYFYSQVMAAALYSVFWFGDPLRPTMAAGATLLIASGVYIWWRERVRGRGDVPR